MDLKKLSPCVTPTPNVRCNHNKSGTLSHVEKYAHTHSAQNPRRVTGRLEASAPQNALPYPKTCCKHQHWHSFSRRYPLASRLLPYYLQFFNRGCLRILTQAQWRPSMK